MIEFEDEERLGKVKEMQSWIVKGLDESFEELRYGDGLMFAPWYLRSSKMLEAIIKSIEVLFYVYFERSGLLDSRYLL